MSHCRAGLVSAGVALFLLFSTPSNAGGEAPDRLLEDRGERLRSGVLQIDAGESALLDTGGLGFDSVGDTVIRLTEQAGSEVVVRVTPLGEDGAVLGSGRIVVIDAYEAREIRLREVTGYESAVAALRVESFEGEGSVEAIAPAGFELAKEQIPATGTSSRRRAIRMLTSNALIDQAEASGAIDAETAMVYRVYALFGDARLPPQYQGTNDNAEDSLYLAEVRNSFSSLSEATQLLLQPFLTPPAYASSWANSSASPAVSALDVPPPCQIFSDRWVPIDSTNGLVRVWYRANSDDALRASGIVAAVDGTIWPALSGLMPTHLPLSDLGESCNSGNGRLDIYLVDATKSATVPFSGCATVPVFILLKRNHPPALAAHEIFHAFQFSFPLAGCIFDRAKYRWWAESSAEWAQDFVYPADNLEHGKAPNYLGVPEEPLDLPDDQHAYGAYLFPFFMRLKAGGTAAIRQAWEACAGKPALEALDGVIPGGFATVWPEFAKSNWNRDPIKDYQTADGLMEGAALAAGARQDVGLGSQKDGTVTIDVNLPRLSATYTSFVFSDDNTRTVVFWNGVTNKLILQDGDYRTEAAPADRKKGAKVEALVKIRGQSWRVEDWTNRPYVTFCRDMIAERIDELVIIISNSEFADRGRRLQPTGLPPVLWVSNMGCYQWKGTADLRATDGLSTIEMHTTVTWKRQGGNPPLIGYIGEGTLNWRVSGPCNGNGSFPLSPALSQLRTFNFTTSGGVNHRGYHPSGLDIHSVTVTCPDSQPATVNLVPWLIVPAENIPGPGSDPLDVEPSGKVMDYSVPNASIMWQWHFDAERE